MGGWRADGQAGVSGSLQTGVSAGPRAVSFISASCCLYDLNVRRVNLRLVRVAVFNICLK